jgi:hypothetical protein
MLTDEYAARFSQPVTRLDCVAIAKEIKGRPKEVFTLLALAENYKPGVSWRAGWVIAILGESGFIGPEGYVETIIRIAATTPDVAVVRGVLRGLKSYKDFTEDQEGALAEACFKWLDRPGTHVSTLQIATQYVLKLCIKYPELWPELEQRLSRYKLETSAGCAAIMRYATDVYKKSIAPKLGK